MSLTPEQRRAYRLNIGDCLADAYHASNGSQTELARRLGIPIGTLTGWITKHGIANSPRRDDEPPEAPRELPADPAEVVALKRKLARVEAETKSLRAQLKHAGEHANLVDDITALIAPVIDRIAAPAYKPAPKLNRRTDEAVTLVWHLTDLHFGEIVDPSTIVGVNAYSPQIAVARIEHAWDTIRKIAADTHAGVSELVIAVNGDTIGGAIHPDSTEYYAGVAVQTIAAAEILAQLGAEAAREFDRVRFLGTVGNHPRSQQKQPTGRALVETSWEYVIHRHAAALMRELSNVEYEIAPGYVLDTTIGPSRWAFSHGDAARGGGGSLGIPAYGLKRQHDANREWSLVIAEMTDQAASSVVKHSRYGHFHTYFHWQAGHADIALMPSPKGADPYVLHSLGKYSPPQMVVELVHPEHDTIGSRVIDLSSVRERATRWDWTTAA